VTAVRARPLREEDVDADPLRQFETWFADARRAGVRAPEAAVLATATPDGAPSARMVLVKSFGPDGFAFFTGTRSRKGRELRANPRAALLFHWDPLGRQVRVEGGVEPLAREEAAAYFATGAGSGSSPESSSSGSIGRIGSTTACATGARRAAGASSASRRRAGYAETVRHVAAVAGGGPARSGNALNSYPRRRSGRMALRRRIVASLFALAALLSVTGEAAAVGGRYTVVGGKPAHRAEVRAALDASTFDWSRVPARITIHVASGAHPHAVPGHIWLDASLLAAGRFSWAVVQHEYAHQVDFFLLDPARRAFLNAALGGLDWCGAVTGLHHAAYGCERFASTLAWAYWPSPQNALRPEAGTDEAAAMPAPAFRSLLSGLLKPAVSA
jgi:pyridoxine/pyridoxamine 5'-phosphate oxidase